MEFLVSIAFMSICPGDGIGIHAGLRSRILRVRVSPGAPSFVSVDVEKAYVGIHV